MKKIDKLEAPFNAVVEAFGDDKCYAFCYAGKCKYLYQHGESLEEAAEKLWIDICDRDCYDSCLNITFYANGIAFSAEGLAGVFHYIFDHGRISFVDALWNDLKHDIIDAFKENDKWNLNGWTIEEAVDEMIALWQTGSCDSTPWEICDDWAFISEEFNDIVFTPKD